MPCNLICERFLKNIAKWRGRTGTGARQWSGSKDKYDDRVYDMRVLKSPGSLTSQEEKRQYRRCGKCEIILKKPINQCPCCDNTQLSLLPYSLNKIADKKGVLKRY